MTETCAGFGSLFEGCEMSKDTITGLPWVADVNSSSLVATEVKIDTKNKAKSGKECFPTTVNLNFANLTLTPNSTGAIESFALSGEGLAETNVGNLAIAAEGSLAVSEAAKGTYGLELFDPPPPKEGALQDVTTGVTVGKGTTIDLTGEAQFTSLGTGIICSVHASIETTDETAETGVGNIEVTTETCEGFGFLYQGCQVTEDEVAQYHFDVNLTDFVATNVEASTTLVNCESGLAFTDITFESITVTPDAFGEHGGITEVELSGEGEAHADPGTLGIEAHGILEVLGEDADTYST